MKRTSAVTVMAYRNTATGPDGTLDVAAAELAAGAALGRPVRIGQETNDLGHDPTAVKQTFAGHDRPARWSDQLTAVDAGAAPGPPTPGSPSTTRRAPTRWRPEQPSCFAGAYAAATIASHLADCARRGPG